jgi:acyl-CoA thioester hydrolase
MPDPRIYSYRFTIPPEVIDGYGHVNNVAYVQWMQDVAIRHGENTPGYHLPVNAGWFAREHRITYLLPTFLGEEIEIRTWISEIRRVRVHRRYEFVRCTDGNVVATGETDWIYVDLASGKPLSIPPDIQSFQILPD